MANPHPNPDSTDGSQQILIELSNLLTEARGFKARYDNQLKTFQRSNAVWRVISGAFIDYLENEYDLDRSRLNEAERTFYSAWVQSPQYHQLELQLDTLIDRSAQVLARAFRKTLSLREVHSAVKLTTKATRLAAIIASSLSTAQAWVATGKKLPVRRTPRTKVGTRKARQVKTLLPTTWWEWLTVVAAFIAIIVYLPSLLGVSRWAAAGLGALTVLILLVIDVGVRWAAVPKSK
jgi:hypothetical protein